MDLRDSILFNTVLGVSFPIFERW